MVFLISDPQNRSTDEASFEGRLFIQDGFLLVYFLSAIATGWIFRYIPVLIGFLSAIPILIVGAYGAIRG